MRSHLARLVFFVSLSPLSSGFAEPCSSGEVVCLMDDSLVADSVGTELGADGAWSALIPHGIGALAPALVLDTRSRRLLTFGGRPVGPSMVWQLLLDRPDSWLPLAATGMPLTPRRSAAAIYDPRADRMIVFGGYDDGRFLGDSWELRLDPTPRWTPLEAAGTPPPPLAEPATVYDPVRHRMLVIHGNDGIGPGFRTGRVWALELSGPPRWRELRPAGDAPAPRSGHSAIYDPRRDRVVIFGGSTAAGLLGDLWELRFGARERWNRIEAPGPRPTAREEHSAVHDPILDRMLVFGGVDDLAVYDGSRTVASPSSEVWALDLGLDAGAWRQLEVGAAPDGMWGHRAVIDPESRRMIVYGGMYSTGTTYALQLPKSAAADTAQSLAATAVAPARLAVSFASPERDALRIELALPAAAPVRLELFDVAGRRVESETLTGLGPGFHRTRWEATSRLPAGVYLLRASLGRESLSRKVVLVR